MPVDTTRVISTRRTQKHITEEELKDIELKRLQGELSCAECRRLKLRCDKKIPCGSCCRRGCESICPCGILSAGQGTRFILADTEQLHRKISEMSNRIRQLEDALAILQSSVSDERHPLLDDEYLKLKFGAEALDARKTFSNDGDGEPRQTIDALGTLTLGKFGEMHYFGRSAGSETLMMAEDEDTQFDDDDDGEMPVPLAPELEYLANMLPFLSKHRPNGNSLELIESFLPPHERAYGLCESYLNHATYFFRPIKHDELLKSFMPSIYKTAFLRVQSRISMNSSPPSDQTEEDAYVDLCTPHSLATLFFLFALGALLDLKLAPYNAEAEHYYDLGRAALSLRPVCGSPSLETVQAVGLMATYHSLAGKKYSRDSAWCIMSLAAKLAQSFGLHRDSARWNMDADTVQNRRNLFWEVFAADVSHSLALGRPPAIHLSYVDCKFPEDKEATLSDAGEVQSGFWGMKHNYARNIFNSVAEATLAAQGPTYNTILDIDRKVREMTFPTSLKPYVSPADGEDLYYSSSLSLRDFYASQHRTVTMIYLHRSFFAQAMLDHPANPLLSPFAPSFLTAYRCASVIIKASAHQFDRCEALAMRIWFLLYHTFSAAIIAGTIVTRSPNFNMAPSALNDLDIAVKLFERTAVQSQRAKVALGVLRKLQEKANRAYSNALSSNPGPPVFLSRAQNVNDVEDELAIFGGQARILTWKARNKDGSSQSGSTSPGSGHEESKQEANSFNLYDDANANSKYGPLYSGTQPAQMTHPMESDFTNLQNFGYRTSFMPANVADVNSRPNVYPGDEHADMMRFLSTDPFGNSTEISPSMYSAPPSSSSQSLQPQNMQTGWGSDVRSTSTTQLSTTALNDNHPAWYASDTLPPFQSSSLRPGAFEGSSQPNMDQDYLGSDTIGKYNLQENAALLTSYGMIPPMSNDGKEVPNSSGYRELHRGGSPQAINSNRIVELGLSGESWSDAKWIALMRDCGIVKNSGG